MDKVPGTVIVVVIIVAALTGMWFAWRRRRRAGRDWTADVAFAESSVVEVITGFLVATTLRENHLQRVFAPGLTYRSTVTIEVSPHGLTLVPRGADPVGISWERIDGVRRASVVIDRAVERDGLSVLDWTMTTPDGRRDVSSFFRLDPASFARLKTVCSATQATQESSS